LLRQLGRYEEAVSSYDKALESEPEDEYAWYNQACCYALLGNSALAIASLQQAIHLNFWEYQELAKIDSDFDSLRGNEAFEGLFSMPENA
jgi:tetratricopeptide (TPR) repeat protein